MKIHYLLFLSLSALMLNGCGVGKRATIRHQKSMIEALIQQQSVTTAAVAATTSVDPTIRKGESRNMVSRDTPGQTALERTIIRWQFDSEPRGARISWRVISSIPDIVKNTNETYLTTTPYEETRAFNILGLTYENSRDVVVEIKVARAGYYDQVKRYNVRQAIDQQEISGFFELVKRDAE
jgi:hypothetical protein